mmetsp:Transcript_11567/g.48582  ORF Transcript_11567/g.48582 Transcript_11567/m.48582 type:complete len:432 (-) Transcript_11567:1570-2865(-)|eukprot:PRCOL_00001255-RA
MAVVPSGGWHKRSRAGAPTATLSRADVEPRFLCKRSVDLGSHPSPGPFSGNRMVMMPPAARGDGAGSVRAFLASAGGARALDLPLNKDAIGENGRDLHAGKDGNLLPIAVAGALETHALPQVVHRLELQGLALARPRASSAGGALRATLAAVDASGAATVASVADASIPADSTAAVTPQYRTTPPDKCEPGWAGVDICASNNCALGIARQLARAVDIYDKDMHVRTMHTGAYPTAVRYLDENCLAVTERSYVSVFDVRAGERGGTVARPIPSGMPLYAVDALSSAAGTRAAEFSTGGLMAVGGADRTVSILDAKTWTIRSRWTQCLKFEVTNLKFSASDPRCIYVSGLDTEVALGQWDLGDGSRAKDAQRGAFRGDGAFLGVDVVSAGDVGVDFVGAWCDTNALLTAGFTIGTKGAGDSDGGGAVTQVGGS